jgi:hypothetical protein
LKYIPCCGENGDRTGVAHDPFDAQIFLSISICYSGSQWGHCSEPVYMQVWVRGKKVVEKSGMNEEELVSAMEGFHKSREET